MQLTYALKHRINLHAQLAASCTWKSCVMSAVPKQGPLTHRYLCSFSRASKMSSISSRLRSLFSPNNWSMGLQLFRLRWCFVCTLSRLLVAWTSCRSLDLQTIMRDSACSCDQAGLQLESLTGRPRNMLYRDGSKSKRRVNLCHSDIRTDVEAFRCLA